MATKPCLFGRPLTNAEKQARFRKAHPNYRRKATIFMRKWRKKRKRLNAMAVKESKGT